MNRTYIDISIKALDDDERRIEGWASRVEEDRMGDIVEPKGAVYRLPLPFLLDHDHSQAVGEVTEAHITSAGITFVARIAKIAEPGQAKDLCDRAWAYIKAGLRKSVSIGFRPLEGKPIASGVRYTSWEWLELSAVAIPAHPGAAITAVKGMHDTLVTTPTGIHLSRPVEPGVKLVRVEAPTFYVP